MKRIYLYEYCEALNCPCYGREGEIYICRPIKEGGSFGGRYIVNAGYNVDEMIDNYMGSYWVISLKADCFNFKKIAKIHKLERV